MGTCGGFFGGCRGWGLGVVMGSGLLSVFVAYLAAIAMSQGADFMAVFRFTGTAAIMAYCLGSVGNTIWYGQPLKPFLHDLADGIVFGLLTGAVFAWLWPALESTHLPAIGG